MSDTEDQPVRRYPPLCDEGFLDENEIVVFYLANAAGMKMPVVGVVQKVNYPQTAYDPPPTFDIAFRTSWFNTEETSQRSGLIVLKELCVWRYIEDQRDPTPEELADIKDGCYEEVHPLMFYRDATGTKVFPWPAAAAKPTLTVVK